MPAGPVPGTGGVCPAQKPGDVQHGCGRRSAVRSYNEEMGQESDENTDLPLEGI